MRTGDAVDSVACSKDYWVRNHLMENLQQHLGYSKSIDPNNYMSDLCKNKVASDAGCFFFTVHITVIYFFCFWLFVCVCVCCVCWLVMGKRVWVAVCAPSLTNVHACAHAHTLTRSGNLKHSHTVNKRWQTSDQCSDSGWYATHTVTQLFISFCRTFTRTSIVKGCTSGICEPSLTLNTFKWCIFAL